MGDGQALPKRKLTVTTRDVITSGQGKKGPWTLYDIAAVGEDGQPIDKKLKSFQELPIGELIEVEVELQQHEKYGDSYLLKLPGGAGSRLGPKVDELRERVDNLERGLAWLSKELEKLGGARAPSTGSQPEANAAPAAAPPAAAPATSDDDIPF